VLSKSAGSSIVSRLASGLIGSSTVICRSGGGFISVDPSELEVTPITDELPRAVRAHAGDGWCENIKSLIGLLTNSLVTRAATSINKADRFLLGWATPMRPRNSVLLVFLVATATAQTPDAAPGSKLDIPSIVNLRDIGGYKTHDGHVVRKKLLYRSGALGRCSPEDLAKLGGLNLKCDFDLRLNNERIDLPDRVPPGVNVISLNVLADSDGSASAQLGRLMRRPKDVTAEKAIELSQAAMSQAFRELVTLPSAKKAYRQLFLELGQEDSLPAIIHCTYGKDRTGWAIAALLTLLGVPENVVIEDYLRSNENVLPVYQRAIDNFAREGGDPNVAKIIVSVRAEYLKSGFDEVKKQYGSIEGYFSKALQIDAAGQQRLKDRFLARP
jgi:protein-tyrosine phosphatase